MIVILAFSLIILGISFQFFGGKDKALLVALLLGFGTNYVSDFLFSFTTTNNTYYNGSFVDFAIFLALSLIIFGILGFYK